MASPFEGFEVDEDVRPSARQFAFDLNRTLSSVVALEAHVPDEAFTAETLGRRRVGNGIVISDEGLVLTIGYLITEADQVTLITGDDRRVPAHVLGYDQVTGLGLVLALESLDLPALPLGDSGRLQEEDAVILAGGGGRKHAAAGRLLARQPFAGYWEYALKSALFVAPAHPHWSGAALINTDGELVGVGSLRMEVQTSGGEGLPITMCVPAELLRPILDDLSRGRPAHPPRPWLGVFSQELGAHVVVTDVAPGGPADRAELRRGDLILAVGGHAVSSLGDFYQRLWAVGPAGVRVPLTLKRERDVFDVEVRSIDRTSMLKKPRFN